MLGNAQRPSLPQTSCNHPQEVNSNYVHVILLLLCIYIYTKVSIIVVVLYYTIIIICFYCTCVFSLFAYDIILYYGIPLCRYKLCNRMSLGVLKKLQYEGYVPKLGKNSVLRNQISCTMNEKYASFHFSLSFYLFFSCIYYILQTSEALHYL